MHGSSRLPKGDLDHALTMSPLRILEGSLR